MVGAEAARRLFTGFCARNGLMVSFMSLSYDAYKLTEAVDRFSEVNVLVVGDVMLDEFVWGSVERISPEAPVPVVEVTEETQLLGGAANVINNIVSAGGGARLAGVIGRDNSGKKIVEMIDKLCVSPRGLIMDPARPTTIKTRLLTVRISTVTSRSRIRPPERPNPVILCIITLLVSSVLSGLNIFS